MSKLTQAKAMATVMAVAIILTGCGASRDSRVEHYVSPKVQGEAQKINLDEVQKAFWECKGKDFDAWMGAFEKRVNEIYDGKDVVSIDATRKEGKLVVIGYIDNKKQQGFVDGDEKLFTIEQTGEAVNNELPYRVSGYDDRPYYAGHHSILDNPFFQMMFISHMMGGWGGRYYTPPTRTIVLHNYRDSFRDTPQYGQQQANNRGFFSRFKTSPSGSLQSSRGFGGDTFSSSTAGKRSWFGDGNAAAGGSSAVSTSSWGGRRSSGGSMFSTRRSWGGFRRR